MKILKTDHVQCLGGSPGHCISQHRLAPALHTLSFENFVKSMPPSLSELKVTPSFSFAFKIPDDRAVTNNYSVENLRNQSVINRSFANEEDKKDQSILSLD